MRRLPNSIYSDCKSGLARHSDAHTLRNPCSFSVDHAPDLLPFDNADDFGFNSAGSHAKFYGKSYAYKMSG